MNWIADRRVTPCTGGDLAAEGYHLDVTVIHTRPRSLDDDAQRVGQVQLLLVLSSLILLLLVVLHILSLFLLLLTLTARPQALFQPHDEGEDEDDDDDRPD